MRSSSSMNLKPLFGSKPSSSLVAMRLSLLGLALATGVFFYLAALAASWLGIWHTALTLVLALSATARDYAFKASL